MKITKEKRIKIILINALVAWILFSAMAFCVDGFVLHNISTQNGEITDLSQTNTGYSNSMVVDAENYPQNGQVFLVEKDEQIHVLYFKIHFPTGRYALKSDTIVQTDGAQKVVVDDGIENVVITIEDKSITNVSLHYFAATDNGFVYMAIALLLTAVETAILWFFINKENSAGFSKRWLVIAAIWIILCLLNILTYSRTSSLIINVVALVIWTVVAIIEIVKYFRLRKYSGN